MAETESPNEKKIAAARRHLLKLRPASLVSWRDAVATLGPIVLISAMTIVVLLHVVRPAPPRTLTMAGGPENSNFRMVAGKYQKILARNGVNVKMPGAFADQVYILRRHIKFVREGLTPGGTRKDEHQAVVT